MNLETKKDAIAYQVYCQAYDLPINDDRVLSYYIHEIKPRID